MKSCKKFVLVLLILQPFALRLRAQDQIEEPVLEATFSVLPLERANWKGIFYAPDGDPESETVEVVFNPHERSESYDYKGQTPLRFFRKTTGQEGTITYVTVAMVRPRAITYKSDLIFFFTPQQENGPYDVQYMLDSERNFPDESIVFYNTMNVNFIGLVGDKTVELPPGASSPLMVKDFFKEEAPIVVAIRDGDDLHFVIKNKISFAPERRTLFILRKPKSPTSMRLRTQRITEFTGERSGSGEED